MAKSHNKQLVVDTQGNLRQPAVTMSFKFVIRRSGVRVPQPAPQLNKQFQLVIKFTLNVIQENYYLGFHWGSKWYQKRPLLPFT